MTSHTTSAHHCFSMPNAKLHINRTISDAHLDDRYLGINISSFYIGTDMPYHRYMQVHPYKIQKEVWDEYDIKMSPDGFANLEIRKGMYGLKEAGVLAFKKLLKLLLPTDMNLCQTPHACGHTIHAIPPFSCVLATME